ncbi:ornithine carbamoyltransferase [Micromonospora echinofusca]|uniref:Ornithine carbamoyltransferase n=1 Tax=Micromonospora echinofusca TaxID=47858 RepID=A0A1C5GG75_MICEH|nr:ornithine carbamoyltransferase [Micromonospora echinofusca]
MPGHRSARLYGVRHLTSVDNLSDDELYRLVRRSAWYAEQGEAVGQPLRGRVVGSYFRATSTRTRTAFASAALRLGASHIAYGPHDLQLNTGETMADTARVLGMMLDALVVRTAGDPAELAALTAQDGMAVVNAMTADEHPTQAIADLSMIELQFGRVDGIRILYVGEGNNTAAALALALARFRDVSLCLATPRGYGMDPALLARAQRAAETNASSITETHELAAGPSEVDVVYTTRWQTTGTSKPDPNWRDTFAPFQVDGELMARYPEAVFMHDLPAHRGEEVTSAVLDGPASIAFRQAEQKFHSAKAVLEWCVGGTDSR